MPLDVSLEAIEAELAIASRGGQVADLAVRRAQVLATLLAARPADHQGRHEAPTTDRDNGQGRWPQHRRGPRRRR
jgi:hypothetical protein